MPVRGCGAAHGQRACRREPRGAVLTDGAREAVWRAPCAAGWLASVYSSELLGEEGKCCAALPGVLVMADAGAGATAEQTPEQDLQGKLKERLQAEFVSAVDLSDGCGSKFQCVIISTLFEGKPLLVRRLPHLPSRMQILNLLARRNATGWSTKPSRWRWRYAVLRILCMLAPTPVAASRLRCLPASAEYPRAADEDLDTRAVGSQGQTREFRVINRLLRQFSARPVRAWHLQQNVAASHTPAMRGNGACTGGG